MQQQPSPTLDMESKFAAPPSMVTGIQPVTFAAKSAAVDLTGTEATGRISR